MHPPVQRAVRPVTAAPGLVAVLAALVAALLAVLLPPPVAHAASTTSPTVTLTTVPGGSAGVGQPVTLVATVAPATTTGTVTFSDSLTVLASNVPVVHGQASLVVPSLAAGPHSLSAVLRTPTGLADSGWVPFEVHTTPWVSLTANALWAYAGQPVTLTAQVSPGRTGRVAFYDGTHQLGDSNGVALVDGRAVLSVSTLAAGLHSLTVGYSCGTPLCTDRQSSVPLTLDVVPVQVTITLSTPGPLATPWVPLTITARVSPAVTTGRLFFFDDTNPIGTVTEHDGTASLTTTLHGGSHHLDIIWESDQSLARARSAVVPITVTPITPSIKFTLTGIPTPPGETSFYKYVELRAFLNLPTAVGVMKAYWAEQPGCWDSQCNWASLADPYPSKPAGSYVWDDWNWPDSVSGYRVCFASQSPDYASVCAPEQVYTAPR